MRRTITYAVASIFLFLPGCDEQTSKQNGDKRSGLDAKAKTDWLDVRNSTPPETWLLARNVTHATAMNAQTLHQTLETAAEHFGESPRMIANRAVQLETMLRPLGEQETAVSLIAELTSVMGPTGKSPGFGTVGQYYYNLRKNGLSKDQALQDLSKRYGDNG